MHRFPEDCRNSTGVKRILTLDWLSRKSLRWPLVPFSRLDLFATEHHLYQPPDLSFDGSRVWQSQTSSSKALIRKLHATFPALNPILSKYKGKIAVCGGALCRLAVSAPIGDGDCDLFFYGKKDPREGDEEYRGILEDCVGMIAEMSERVVVSRGDCVVNVMVRERLIDGFCERKYQFVLRVYERLDMIIGGFDVGPSMVAFDGEEVYVTWLGGWSIAKRAIIVDTTRRSTSYEMRLVKYQRMGFGIVLPGLDVEVLRRRSYKELRNILRSVGIRYKGKRIEEHLAFDDVSLNGRLAIEVIDADEKLVRLVKRRPNYVKNLEPIPERTLRYSDYMFFDPSFIVMSDRQVAKNQFYKYNASILTTGARERLVVCSQLPRDYKLAVEIFSSMIDNPQIELGDQFQEQHLKWLQERPAFSNLKINFTSSHYRLFAEYFEEYKQLMEESKVTTLGNIEKTKECVKFIEKVSKVLRKRILERAKIWMEDFKGLKWRTQDPSAQHTASFNPIIEDPREFYINCYSPFTIGIPKEVEYCVWLLFHGQLRFPSEVVKLILKLLVERTHLSCPTYPKKTPEQKSKLTKIFYLRIEEDKDDEDLEQMKPNKRRRIEEQSSESTQTFVEYIPNFS